MADNSQAPAAVPPPVDNPNAADTGVHPSRQPQPVLPVLGQMGDAPIIGNSGGVDEEGSDPPPYDNSNEPVEAPTTYSGSQFAAHSNAARFYAERNYSLAALIAMSIGIWVDDGPYFDVTQEPWCSMPKKTITVTNDILREEIKRRAASYEWEGNVPRPNSWNRNDLLKWLETNSIRSLDEHGVHGGPEDEGFLFDEMAAHKALFLKAQQEEAAERDAMEGNWTGQYPHLRLMHCLVDHDEMKDAFLHRHDLNGDRGTIDGRNSDECRKISVWEMIADKWNDKDYEPVTEVISEENGFFTPPYAAEINLSFSNVQRMSAATADKCHSVFQKMMVALRRAKVNFEASGKGRKRDDEGNIIEHRREANYGKDIQHWIVYLWYLLEKHDLMGSSLQVLDDTVGATDGARNAPRLFGDDEDGSSLGSATSKNNDVADFSSSMRLLGQSHLDAAKLEYEQKERDRLQVAAAQKATADVEEKKIRLDSLKMINSSRDSLNAAISDLNREKRAINIQKCKRMLEIGAEASKNDPLVEGLTMNMDMIDEEIAQKKEQIANLAANENSMITTPQKSNVTPNRNASSIN